MRLQLIAYAAHHLELRCETPGDAALLAPQLERMGFTITRDHASNRTLFLYAPKAPASSFTTADQVLTQPAAPQRRLTEA
jgi:hypothetical protein